MPLAKQDYRDDKRDKPGGRRRRRRVMDKFTLEEISFVNRPAQETALSSIMKNASDADLVDDKLWDKLTKVTPTPRSGESRSAFISRFVTNETAKQEYPTRSQRLAVAISTFERADKAADDDDDFEKRFGITDVRDGHQHVLDILGPNGVMSRGTTSYDKGMDAEYSHTHEWIRRDDGSIVILMADGHDHEIMESVTISEEPKLATADPIGKKGGKEKNMPTKKSAEELAAELEKANAETAVLKVVATFTDIEKAHYEGLKDDEAKKAFRDLKPEERKAEAEKATKKKDEEDPVIFKAADGTEYRKSDDPRLIEMAKRDDAREADFKKMREQAEDTRIEKFVNEHLKHHPGDMDTRKAIVKGVEAIKDEKAREAALDALKARDAKFAPAFQTVGAAGNGQDLNKSENLTDKQEAQQELRKLTNDAVTKAVADGKQANYYDVYPEICKAHPELYQRARAS